MPQSDYQRITTELFGGPPKCWARFSLSPELDTKATAATGFAMQVAEITPGMTEAPSGGFKVYRDVIVVEEHAEGERDYVSVKATDEHRRKYPQAWAQFEAQQKNTAHDVRLCQGITPAAIETLSGIGIRTMEGLAECTLDLPENIAKHREFAKRYLAFLTGRKAKFRVVDGVYTPIEDAA